MLYYIRQIVFYLTMLQVFTCVRAGRVKRPSHPVPIGNDMFTEAGLCQIMPAPLNGNISCGLGNMFFECKATCNTGYRFQTGSDEEIRICDDKDGTWIDGTNFPQCQPVCQPGCQNGGTCVLPNICACVTPGWEGDHCQTPSKTCIQPSGPQYGNINCQVLAQETVCTVSCPLGLVFDRQPADRYVCMASSGTWNPPKDKIPNCINPGAATMPSPSLQPTGSSVHPKSGVATCVTWGQDHYRTFDNKMYAFQGKCEYLLARDCVQGTFQVHIINDQSCTPGAQCSREVNIYIDATKIVLRRDTSGPVVEWDGRFLTLPTSRNGVVFEKMGSYIFVTSTIGFKVKWDGREAVFLSVIEDFHGNTCGLCGTFDGNPDNDFRSYATDTVVKSVSSFAQSWKQTGFTASAVCADSPQIACDATRSPAAVTRSNLLQGPVFQKCHAAVDPLSYITATLADCCSNNQDSCVCSSFEAYARACLEAGVELSWRSPQLCPVDCSNNLVHKECGSACQHRCGASTAPCTDDRCIDGCFCPDGQVMLNSSCVLPEQCPCMHNSHEYESGQVIPKDCNQCTCLNGNWHCTTMECKATCSATGDHHYVTFDGKRFNFMGMCSYRMMYDTNYDIIVDNIKCGHGPASCTDGLTINIDHHTIKLGQLHHLAINGNPITSLPYDQEFVKIQMVSSLFMKIKLVNGISILWDGRTRAYITAPPKFIGRTMGLCGTFDSNQNNDYRTKEGDIEMDTNAFGNRWKTLASCADMPVGVVLDPCETNAQRKEQAAYFCDRLKTSTFIPCHDVVDIDIAYEDCMYDLCTCTKNRRECLCPMLGQYAKDCASQGVQLSWRTEVTECGLTCDGGQEYQVCPNECTCTCANIAMDPNCQQSNDCAEGCQCPNGQTLNADGECIPIEQCPCMFDGRELPAGFMAMMGPEACVCKNARWECRVAQIDMTHIDSPCPANMEFTDCSSACPVTCENMHTPPSCNMTRCKAGCQCKSGYVLEGDKCVKAGECPCYHGGKAFYERDKYTVDCNECTCQSRRWTCETKECPAVCSAYGDSHYHTFDGRRFEFEGNCDYILAKSSDDNPQKFLITTENIPCGTSGVTCTRSIDFSIGAPGSVDFYRIQMIRGKTVIPEPGSPFTVREVGNFVFISGPGEILLEWDGGTRVYLKLSTNHKGKVVGLCGNFNNDQKDDFTLPQGGPPSIKATAFANSWKVHDYCGPSKEIVDTCKHVPHRKSWAQRSCGVIQSSLFKRCHSIVPYQPFLERCIFDSCACDSGGDCECLCTAVAAYAHECSISGIPIKWRSEDMCPIQCADCFTYNPCISTCPKRTCGNMWYYTTLTNDCKQESCVEGCDLQPCGPGQILDSSQSPMQCIPEFLCNATACTINGKNYRDGERITDESVCQTDCEICFCSEGNVKHTGYCSSTTTSIATAPFRLTTPRTNFTMTLTTSPSTTSQTSPVVFTVSPLPSSSPTPAVTRTAAPHVSGLTNNVPTLRTELTLPTGCVRTGWTNWMSASVPTPYNLGDEETIPGLRRKYVFCDENMIEAVECRAVGQHIPAADSGQVVECNVRDVLRCEHNDQSGALCMDYEVRFFCDCGTPSQMPMTPVTSPSPSPVTPSLGPKLTTAVTTGSTPRGDDSGTPTLNPTGTTKTPAVTPTMKTGSPPTKPTLYSSAEKTIPTKVTPTASGHTPTPFSPRTSSRPSNITLGLPLTTSAPVTSLSLQCDHPGWSRWVNTDSPSTGDGDIESMMDIINRFGFCSQEQVGYIQCRHKTSHVSFELTADTNTVCNMKSGFRCYNSLQTNGLCEDYEVRVYCSCSESSCQYDLTSATDQVDDKAFSASTAAVNDGHAPHKARQDGGWKPKGDDANPWLQVDLGEPVTVAGIVTKGSSTSLEWVTRYKVQYSLDCKTFQNIQAPDRTAEIFEGNTDSNTEVRHLFRQQITAQCLRVLPMATNIEPVLRLQILGCHSFLPLKTPSMTLPPPARKTTGPSLLSVSTNMPTATSGTGTIQTPSVTPSSGTAGTPTASPGTGVTLVPSTLHVTALPYTCTQGWSNWMNVDTPVANKPYQDEEPGDYEPINALRQYYSFCAKPSSVKCRTADNTHQRYDKTSDAGVNCDLTDGLKCLNKNQATGVCADYEVSVYCECGGKLTTTPTLESTPLPGTPHPPIASCMWSRWMNSHGKTDLPAGDLETFSNLRMHYSFCEYPVKIQCRVAMSSPNFPGVFYDKAGQIGVMCDLNKGLVCDNKGQMAGTNCFDYEIRVYCVDACVSTVPGSTITPSTSVLDISQPTIGPAVTGMSPALTPTTGIPHFPSTTKPVCMEGWTDWINENGPRSGFGDFESVNSIPGYPETCVEVMSVDCRAVTSGNDYTTTGQAVTCDTKNGLRCANNAMQICQDYNVRFYCSCETITTIGQSFSGSTTTDNQPDITTPQSTMPCDHGWTTFMNADTPDDGNGGDYETISALRTNYQFCDENMIAAIRCVVGGTSQGYDQTGQQVTCDRRQGLICNNADQIDGQCQDYAVQFFCDCKESLCAPGEIWESCAYTCDQMCDVMAQITELCGQGSSPKQCVPMCKRPVTCAPSQKLKDKSTCINEDMCPCLKQDGTVAQPYETWTNPQDDCSRCHCFNNAALCSSDGCLSSMSSPVSPSVVPTTQSVTPVIHPECHWTGWINNDNPGSGLGDEESLFKIRSTHTFCANPVNIECRDAGTHQSTTETHQKVTCDLQQGLKCLNWENNGNCKDYEIRFYCPCISTTPRSSEATQSGSLSTPRNDDSRTPANAPQYKTTLTPSTGATGGTVTPSVTPTGSRVAPLCGWSQWVNADSPNKQTRGKPYKGDIESIASIRNSIPVCDHDMMAKIECRTADKKIPHTSSGDNVNCDTIRGLRCKNAMQTDGICEDYEVRVFCDCPAFPSVTPPVATASSSITPTQKPQPTPTAAPIICGWTQWMNDHRPDVTGETELINVLRTNVNFCQTSDIVGMECRTADTQTAAQNAGQMNVLCDLKYGGLICLDTDQPGDGPCYDYEIRVFCQPQGIDCSSPLPSLKPVSQNVPDTTPTGSLAFTSTITPGLVGTEMPSVNLHLGSTEVPTPSGGTFTPSASPPSGGTKTPTATPPTATKVPTKPTGNDSHTTTIAPGTGATQTPLGTLPAGSSNTPTITPSFGSTYKPTMSTSIRITATPPVTMNEECLEPMAAETPITMPDHSLSASSSMSSGTGPQRSHLSSQDDGQKSGAWIPKASSNTDWIQVDFGKPQIVSGIITKGREGSLQFVRAYYILFSADGKTFSYYEDTAGVKKVFPGNFDSTTPVKHVIKPVTAQFVRLQPVAWEGSIALRWGFFACTPSETTKTTTTKSTPLLRTTISISTPLQPARCTEDMGMKNQQVQDEMITASASRDGNSSPHLARLDSAGAWMPGVENKNQFIQVDFVAPRLITGVTTQGKMATPAYVTSYKVTYSYDGANWNTYQETPGVDMIFSANYDSDTAVTHWFARPLRAEYIRIQPQTWYGRIAMRLEVQGCFEPYPSPSVTTIISTPLPRVTGKTPPVVDDCVEWDRWINMGQPLGLNSVGDYEAIRQVIQNSLSCKMPMKIECRTDTGTLYSETGQNVTCNLWQGLACNNSDQSPMPFCYDYKVRLGCLKDIPKCMVATTVVTAANHFTTQIVTTPVVLVASCYAGMDTSSCPQCPAGKYCDGIKCVSKQDCPCLVDSKAIRPGDISQNQNCDTCQCFSGEIRCIPKKCPDCVDGFTKVLNKTTCDCSCKSCDTSEFRCGNGQCIPKAAHCDGVIDCIDDEIGCVSTPVFTITSSPVPSSTRPGSVATVSFSPGTLDHSQPMIVPPSGGTPTVSPSVGTGTFKTPTRPIGDGEITSSTPQAGCAAVTCQPLVQPNLDQGEVARVMKTTDGCCEEMAVTCKPSLCPVTDISCSMPNIVQRVDSNKCCPEFKCACPTTCPPLSKPPCKEGYGLINIACNCSALACLSNPEPTQRWTTSRPVPRPLCEYTMKKTVANGIETVRPTPQDSTYQVGDIWTDGLCKNCQCLNRTDGTSEISCHEQTCPSCKQGEQLVMRPGECCGQCQQLGCVVDGRIYQDGDEVRTKMDCYNQRCTYSQGLDMYIIMATQVTCAIRNTLPICNGNSVTYDATGCCLTCIQLNDSNSLCQACQPQPMFGLPIQSIGFFRVQDKGVLCQNEDEVADLTECSGYCGSTSSYTSVMQGFDNKCKCCQPQTTVARTVQLSCTDGHKIKKSYNVPNSCGCSDCIGG